MRCAKCQFENPEGMSFCGKCGTKLEKICPRCGLSNPPEFSFCGGCGSKLAELLSPLDSSRPASYTPKHLADQILTSRSALEGERKLVTVLFADVANFTSLSEKLDPEEVHQILDGCFQILMEQIHAYEGMSFQFEGRIGRSLSMHTGISTGLAVTGELDLEKGIYGGIIGDTINLAARLSDLAKGSEILVGPETRRWTEGAFTFEPLEPTTLQGKAEPIQAYRVLSAKERPAPPTVSPGCGPISSDGRQSWPSWRKQSSA